jgi:hypothetical protein
MSTPPSPVDPARDRLRIPRAVRPAVLVVVLAQLVAIILSPDLAFPAAAGNSGDSAGYASVETVLIGLPLVGAALALLKWPRVGVVAVSLLELWFVVATRVTNAGTYSGGLTPFIVGTLIVLVGCLAMVWLSRSRATSELQSPRSAGKRSS